MYGLHHWFHVQGVALPVPAMNETGRSLRFQQGSRVSRLEVRPAERRAAWLS